MITKKIEITARKKTATTQAPVVEKKAVTPVAKLAARKPAKANLKPAVKKPEEEPKTKVVRNFSMPQTEYLKIAEIKEACLKAGMRVKKSVVLRAGLRVLGGMNAVQLKQAMAGFGKVRAARPKKP